jgi:hypothetical protein
MSNDSVAITKFEVGFFSRIIPTFGNWCGPGWSAGKFGQNESAALLLAPVVKMPGPDGNLRDSPLDKICKAHDLDYIAAAGMPNEAQLILEADARLVSATINNFDSFGTNEKFYASFMTASFIGKQILYDVPKAGLSKIGDLFQKVANFLDEKTTPTNPFVQLPEDYSANSCQVTPEGRYAFSCTKDGETQTLLIGKSLESIKLYQQIVNESGQVCEETRLHVNVESSVTELIHSTDGINDVKGVIIGGVTQERLDQFCELGSLAINPPDVPDAPVLPDAPLPDTGPDADRDAFPALQLLDSLDIPLDDFSPAEFGSWFNDLDPIFIEPYQWSQVDPALENFWFRGTDESLAAYDLGGVIEDTSWRTDLWASDWTPPPVDTFFSDLPDGTGFSSGIGTDPYTYVPDPIYFFDNFGSGSSSADIGGFYFADPAPSSPSFTGSSFSDSFFSYIDPLVLKLGGGSVHTTHAAGSSVRFDMNGDGVKEKTGWITADHAFLVRDLNKNGRVDSIAEMFSEQTSATAHTGFSALAELDSKRDGRIDKSDKAFADLRLWTDINANGGTDSGELHKLSRFGIKSIDIGQVEARNQYDNGNMVLGATRYTASYKDKTYTGEIAEVLFNFGEPEPVANLYLSDQATAVRTADGKVIEVLNGAGAQKVNASLSGVNVLVGGAGDVLNAGNAGQSLLIGNGGTTLNGNAGEVHFIVNGSQNVVNTGTGHSVIEVQGDANTINAVKGDADITVDGNRNKLSIGSGADVDLGGAGNTLTAAAKSGGNTIAITGVGQMVSASNATIALGEHAGVTLAGKDNAISMAGEATLAGKATGGTLVVAGDGNVASLSGAFITVTEGAELKLTGTKEQVVLAGDASLVMISSAKDSTISVFGEGNQLTASKATIRLDDGAGLTLNGSNNKLTLTGDGTLEANGSSQVIDVYGRDNQVDADRSKLIEHGLADLTLTGLGNTLKVTPDTSSAVSKEQLALGNVNRLLDQAWASYEKVVGAAALVIDTAAADQTLAAELTGISSLQEVQPVLVI